MNPQNYSRNDAADAVSPSPLNTTATRVVLTPKEQEVMHWIALGKSAWEISRIQGRSEAVVNFHACNIRRKFGVSSMRAALVMALDQGGVFSR